MRQETYKNEYNKDHKRGLSAKSLFSIKSLFRIKCVLSTIYSHNIPISLYIKKKGKSIVLCNYHICTEFRKMCRKL